MSRFDAIAYAAAALAVALPQVTPEDARARGLLPMNGAGQSTDPSLKRPDNPTALLGKHTGRIRKGKRLWRA